jgi:hypothetical protein
MNKRKRVEIREKIKSVFSDLIFDEPTHFYGLKSDPSYRFKKSVSKLADAVKEGFNEEYWLTKKGEEKQLKDVVLGNEVRPLEEYREELRAEWKNTRDVSATRGTQIHKELEDYTQDNRKKASDVTKRINKWFIANGYLLIGNELRVYDKESGISGTLDILAYNIYDNSFYILDFKTNRNKLIEKVETYIDKKTGKKKKSKFMLKAPFENYPQSKYYEYCIQLNGYKYILEKHTDIKIKGIILIQISDILFPEDQFKIIPGESINVDCLFKS